MVSMYVEAPTLGRGICGAAGSRERLPRPSSTRDPSCRRYAVGLARRAPLLPDLLARLRTRVRAVAPGVTLPEPWPDRRTPPSALRPEYRAVLPAQPALTLTGFTTTTEPTEATA